MLCPWKSTTLSLFGKVTLVNSLCTSQCTYLLMSLPSPNKAFYTKYDELVFSFLWNNKPERPSCFLCNIHPIFKYNLFMFAQISNTHFQCLQNIFVNLSPFFFFFKRYDTGIAIIGIFHLSLWMPFCNT